MANYLISRTLLIIINTVLRRLGLSQVSNVDENSLSSMAVEMFNDVLDDVTDYGNWPQLYATYAGVAQSSVGQYKLNIEAKTIYDIAWNGQVSPLRFTQVNEIRRLQRISSYGIPRYFSIVSVSANAPTIAVYPTPTSADAFNVAYYARPQTFAADASNNGVLVPLPSRMLIQGLYANMLLEESGGQPTPESQAAFMLYSTMKRETFNRFVNDYGDAIQFVPYGNSL